MIPFLTQVDAVLFQKQSPISKHPSCPMSKIQSSHFAAMWFPQLTVSFDNGGSNPPLSRNNKNWFAN